MADYDVAVFGAGISGLSISNALLKRGKRVLLIDPHIAGPEDYRAPAGLVNPAAGRKANMSWRAEQCLNQFKANLELLTEASGRDDLYTDSGVLRPAITEELAGNFKRSLNRHPWPDGWIEWLDETQTRHVNPDIAENFGGLFLRCGMTVFVDNYLGTYRNYLQKHGVDFSTETVEYRRRGSGFSLFAGGKEIAAAENVVVAAGPGLSVFPDWSDLPLEFVKGQLVVFETGADLAWNHGISALGYLLRRGRDQLIAGSTYEHNYENLQTTEEGYRRIHHKFSGMLPGLAGKAVKKGQIAGVRVTTPDHLPVIGRHPEVENLYIYSGMGSKGLIFSEYLASLLCSSIVENGELPSELNVRRFYPGN